MAQASVGQVRDDAEASPLVSISLHVVQEADLASALHPCWATIGQTWKHRASVSLLCLVVGGASAEGAGANRCSRWPRNGNRWNRTGDGLTPWLQGWHRCEHRQAYNTAVCCHSDAQAMQVPTPGLQAKAKPKTQHSRVAVPSLSWILGQPSCTLHAGHRPRPNRSYSTRSRF